MNEELQRIIMPALSCPLFCQTCKLNGIRFDPEHGHIPRGYAGGNAADLSAVQLVIVTAEPGEPKPGKEVHRGEPEELFQQAVGLFDRLWMEQRGRFYPNLKHLLDGCWPGLSHEERMRRTWFTNAVLCSAVTSTGPVAREVEETCGKEYFVPQMNLVPDAFVIALGVKANRRAKRLLNDREVVKADHPSRRGSPLPSYDVAAGAFRRWLEQGERTRAV